MQTTMREANDRGYECLLVEDATESYFPEFKAATLDMVRAQGGIVGWTAPSRERLSVPSRRLRLEIRRKTRRACAAAKGWEPLREGFDVLRLWGDPNAGPSVALLALRARRAGAAAPALPGSSSFS